MKSLGHTVYLYAGDQNEAPCDELVTCFTEQERADFVGDRFYVNASFDWTLPHWQKFNNTVIQEISKRAEKEDFICLIAGYAHKPIADALPHMISVEFGIGYGGSFANYKVFESYAWMHTCYGSKTTDPHSLNGRFYDAVIPSYVDVNEFPFREKPDDYYLYIGRLIERKGYKIAVGVCEQLGKRLIVAGDGTPPEYGEYVGVVGPERRAELMAGAIATFAPTIYIEPFGTVVPEAMTCGTPAITTDFGAFTETVIDGVTGFRCHTLQEFIDATIDAPNLDRKKIRQHAVDNYSLEAVAIKYDRYFKRLLTLWGHGWYELR